MLTLKQDGSWSSSYTGFLKYAIQQLTSSSTNFLVHPLPFSSHKTWLPPHSTIPLPWSVRWWDQTSPLIQTLEAHLNHSFPTLQCLLTIFLILTSLSFKSQQHHFRAGCLFRSLAFLPTLLSLHCLWTRRLWILGPFPAWTHSCKGQRILKPVSAMKWLLPAAPVMFQNNRRGQRGAAREKHVCSEIRGHGSGPRVGSVCHAWNTPGFYTQGLTNSTPTQAAVGQFQLCRARLVPCVQWPEPWPCPRLSQHNATGKWEILVTEGISNILFPSHKSTAAKSTQFSLLGKEHTTCMKSTFLHQKGAVY